MTVPLCELLDGFLGNGLTEPERLAFHAHLAVCPGCRQLVREQQQVNCWLKEAVSLRTPTPPALIGRIEQQVRRAERRRRIQRLAGGIAAVFLAGSFAAWWQWRPRSHDDATRAGITEAPVPNPSNSASPHCSVHVTFSHPNEIVAVPRKTDNPGVTIIWLYPAVQSLPDSAPTGHTKPNERSG